MRFALCAACTWRSETWNDADTASDVAALLASPYGVGADAGGGSEAHIAGALRALRAAIAADAQLPALKALQGRILARGYAAGELHGALFPDVAPTLAAAAAAGVRVYIYSAGSRAAQRQLFQHAQWADGCGDMRRFISGYFDASCAGPKRDASSYAGIALSVCADAPANILFVTDVAEEAAAALGAGWRAALVERPGNAPLPPPAALPRGVRVVASLAELALQ
jgi:methylthioribulose 1-phosphate dehydratase/enolase-phosphatase E1